MALLFASSIFIKYFDLNPKKKKMKRRVYWIVPILTFFLVWACSSDNDDTQDRTDDVGMTDDDGGTTDDDGTSMTFDRSAMLG